MTQGRSTCSAAAIGALMAALVLAPSMARAQDPVRVFEQLDTRLKPGDTIWVTDLSGREIKGKLRKLSSTSLLLDAGGAPQDFQAARVGTVRLQTTDSLKNGVLWGALTGFGAGWLSCAANPECAEDDGGSRMSVAFGILGAAVGAGIGAAIDAAIKGPKLVVYRGVGPQAASRLLLSPIVTARRQGVRLSFSF